MAQSDFTFKTFNSGVDYWKARGYEYDSGTNKYRTWFQYPDTGRNVTFSCYAYSNKVKGAGVIGTNTASGVSHIVDGTKGVSMRIKFLATTNSANSPAVGLFAKDSSTSKDSGYLYKFAGSSSISATYFSYTINGVYNQISSVTKTVTYRELRMDIEPVLDDDGNFLQDKLSFYVRNVGQEWPDPTIVLTGDNTVPWDDPDRYEYGFVVDEITVDDFEIYLSD